MDFSYGFDPSFSLQKKHTGVIRRKYENGIVYGDPVVYFEFRHDIPAKEAATLLIQRMTEFLAECDKYNIV